MRVDSPRTRRHRRWAPVRRSTLFSVLGRMMPARRRRIVRQRAVFVAALGGRSRRSFGPLQLTRTRKSAESGSMRSGRRGRSLRRGSKRLRLHRWAHTCSAIVDTRTGRSTRMWLGRRHLRARMKPRNGHDGSRARCSSCRCPRRTPRVHGKAAQAENTDGARRCRRSELRKHSPCITARQPATSSSGATPLVT